MSEQNSVLELIERGMNWARREEWSGAAEVFHRAVTLDSESVEARYRLGWALWKQAEAIAPTLSDLALGFGAQVLGFDGVARDKGTKFRKHKKIVQDSAHWLREAIARDAKHADAHFYLARCLKVLGYKDEAMEMARRAAALQPSVTRYASLLNSFTTDSYTPATANTTTVDTSKLSWDDLILPPRTKRELRQMQIVMEKPNIARELGVELPTGILLKGAPGTGKTTIARVLANEAQCRFISISPADINQMYVGESEKRVQELFAKARTEAPSIIFIDEIDALLPSRQGGVAIHSDKVVNQFLQEMDGMTPNKRVFIVGATNRPDMLDPAVRRGGRLSREIEIPLPDRDSRLELFKLFTRQVSLSEDVDLEALADKTEGYSGADIRAVVSEAGLQAMIRLADTVDTEPCKHLSAIDFDEALVNLNEE